MCQDMLNTPWRAMFFIFDLGNLDCQLQKRKNWFGRLASMSTPAAVHMILSEHQIGLKQISENISFEPVNHIIHEDLDMRTIFAKQIPKYLNVDRQRRRVEEPRWICARFEKVADFLRLVVVMDETWIHSYQSETKEQLIEKRPSGSSSSTKFHVQKSVAKVLA